MEIHNEIFSAIDSRPFPLSLFSVFSVATMNKLSLKYILHITSFQFHSASLSNIFQLQTPTLLSKEGAHSQQFPFYLSAGMLWSVLYAARESL